MNSIPRIINYLFKKRNISTEYETINSIFDDGLCFPKLVAISFNEEKIKHIYTDPKTPEKIQFNNNRAFRHLLQKNENIAKLLPEYLKEKNIDDYNEQEKIKLLTLIIRKQIFKINYQEIFEKCNFLLAPLSLKFNELNDIVCAKCIFGLLNILTGGKVKYDSKIDSFNQNIVEAFKIAAAPLVIDKASLKPKNHFFFFIQIEILFDNFSDKFNEIASKSNWRPEPNSNEIDNAKIDEIFDSQIGIQNNDDSDSQSNKFEEEEIDEELSLAKSKKVDAGFEEEEVDEDLNLTKSKQCDAGLEEEEIDEDLNLTKSKKVGENFEEEEVDEGLEKSKKNSAGKSIKGEKEDDAQSKSKSVRHKASINTGEAGKSSAIYHQKGDEFLNFEVDGSEDDNDNDDDEESYKSYSEYEEEEEAMMEDINADNVRVGSKICFFKKKKEEKNDAKKHGKLFHRKEKKTVVQNEKNDDSDDNASVLKKVFKRFDSSEEQIKENMKNRMKMCDKALLKAINAVGKDGNFEFSSFIDSVQDDSIPKYVMYLCKRNRIDGVELTNDKNKQIMNINEVIRFLSYYEPSFSNLALDFQKKKFVESSAKLFYSNLLNLFYLKQSRQEIFERCLRFILVDPYKNDERFILTQWNTYTKLLSYSKNKEKIPILFGERFVDLFKETNEELPLVIYIQLQFILDDIDQSSYTKKVTENYDKSFLRTIYENDYETIQNPLGFGIDYLVGGKKEVIFINKLKKRKVKHTKAFKEFWNPINNTFMFSNGYFFYSYEFKKRSPPDQEIWNQAFQHANKKFKQKNLEICFDKHTKDSVEIYKIFT